MFGLSLKEETNVYWGARAIYKGYTDNYRVDLLPDRQHYEGEDDQVFLAWLNGRALPWLRAKVRQLALSTDSNEVLELQEYKYILKASPNGSYGYLYIGAGELPVEQGEPFVNRFTQDEEPVLLVGDKKLVWRDDCEVPAIGDTVDVKMNSIGRGKVVGYTDDSYPDGYRILLLCVDLFDPPEWLEDQTRRWDEEHWLADNFYYWIDEDRDHYHDMSVQDKQMERLQYIRRFPSPRLTAEGKKKFKTWQNSYKLSPAIVFPNDISIPTGV